MSNLQVPSLEVPSALNLTKACTCCHNLQMDIYSNKSLHAGTCTCSFALKSWCRLSTHYDSFFHQRKLRHDLWLLSKLMTQTIWQMFKLYLLNEFNWSIFKIKGCSVATPTWLSFIRYQYTPRNVWCSCYSN